MVGRWMAALGHPLSRNSKLARGACEEDDSVRVLQSWNKRTPGRWLNETVMMGRVLPNGRAESRDRNLRRARVEQREMMRLPIENRKDMLLEINSSLS